MALPTSASDDIVNNFYGRSPMPAAGPGLGQLPPLAQYSGLGNVVPPQGMMLASTGATPGTPPPPQVATPVPASGLPPDAPNLQPPAAPPVPADAGMTADNPALRGHRGTPFTSTPSPVPAPGAPMPPVRPAGLGVVPLPPHRPAGLGAPQQPAGQPIAHVQGPDWLKNFFLAGSPSPQGMTALLNRESRPEGDRGGMR